MSSVFDRGNFIARDYPKKISLVIPCYNEEEVLPELRRHLVAFAEKLKCDVEFILINDGSRDLTLKLLLDWAKLDHRVKVLGLSRNFGHQLAVTAGLDHASSDAVVVIDGDLQDPLEVIFEMISKYQEGYDVVYGQRRQRAGETVFKRMTAWIFYRLMRKLVHKDLPVDTGDFRLISLEALNALRSMRETHRFLRGMGAWLGFNQCPVFYDRHVRAAGESKYPLRKMLSFSWTAAVSFSTLPLRLSVLFGVLVSGLGLLVGAYSVFQVISYRLGYAYADGYSAGWASLVTLICVVGGTILIFLGVIGEYVGRIYEEVKDRPLYLVQTKVNFSLLPSKPE